MKAEEPKLGIAARDVQGRLQWKLSLVKMLYQRGYKKKEIIELFRFIDCLLVLPEELQAGFCEGLRQYEEDIKMSYGTSIALGGVEQ